MYTVTDIDRHGCKRVVPMKVLVLGLNRTGTESLRKALQQLGYNETYHGYTACLENARDSEIWLEAMHAKFDKVGKEFGRDDFDQVLGHCQAVTDVPAACFASELIEAYPEAKVVLTLRDVNDWHRSIITGVLRDAYSPQAIIASYLAWLFRSPGRWARPMMCRIWEDYYKGFEENGKQVFKEHYDMVRRLVPPERLLEFRVQDGWGPLCEFLNQKVPKNSFPNSNDRLETAAKVRAAIKYELTKAFASFLWIFVIIGALVAGTRHYEISNLSNRLNYR